MIESGRYKDIPKDKRYCRFCPSQLETEIHFLLSCQAYKMFRCELLAPFLIENAFSNKCYSIKEKVRHIMASNTNIYDLGAYISKCFELRTIILEPLTQIISPIHNDFPSPYII